MLWLPYVTAHYVLTTDDLDVLNVKIPFIEAPPLDPGVVESYSQATPSRDAGDALRALRARDPEGHRRPARTACRSSAAATGTTG